MNRSSIEIINYGCGVLQEMAFKCKNPHECNCPYECNDSFPLQKMKVTTLVVIQCLQYYCQKTLYISGVRSTYFIYLKKVSSWFTEQAMGWSVSNVQSSHHHELDHAPSDADTFLVGVFQSPVLANHPHDQRLIIAVRNSDTDTVDVSPHRDPVPGVSHSRQKGTVDLSCTLIDIDTDVDATTTVVHCSNTNLINDIEILIQGSVACVDGGTLVSDQVEPLIRPSMDLIAHGELCQIQGS